MEGLVKLSLCMNGFSWAVPSFKRGSVELLEETYELEYYSKFN